MNKIEPIVDWLTTVHPAGSAAEVHKFIYLSEKFPRKSQLWAEVNEVLASGGLGLIVERIIPGSNLRGKRGRLQRRAGEWVNSWLRYAGAGNGRLLSAVEWRAGCDKNSLTLCAEQIVNHSFTISSLNPKLSPEKKLKAKIMLLQAPVPVVDFLTPHLEGDRIAFQLKSMFILVERSTNLRQDKPQVNSGE